MVLTIIGIPLLIFSDTVAFPIVISLISVMGTFEILRVINASKNLFFAVPSYIISALLPFGAFFAPDILVYISTMAVALFVFLLYLFAVAIFAKGSFKYSQISEAFASVTYIATSLSAMCYLGNLEGGKFNLPLVFVGAWVCDISAYFVGTLIGKHKLIPEVSPKKTVEGAIGGVVFTSIAFVLYGFIVSKFTNYTPNYPVLTLTGIIVPVISQLGDLTASLIKREHGVKDYGNILPGHGGILDRFDSAIPVAMVLMIICARFQFFS